MVPGAVRTHEHPLPPSPGSRRGPSNRPSHRLDWEGWTACRRRRMAYNGSNRRFNRLKECGKSLVEPSIRLHSSLALRHQQPPYSSRGESSIKVFAMPAKHTHEHKCHAPLHCLRVGWAFRRVRGIPVKATALDIEHHSLHKLLQIPAWCLNARLGLHRRRQPHLNAKAVRNRRSRALLQSPKAAVRTP